jgi:hypothetical protein
VYIVPAGQKGYHSGSEGYKDQVWISKTTFEDYRKRKKA